MFLLFHFPLNETWPFFRTNSISIHQKNDFNLRTYDPAFLRTFLDRSSISQILHHISFLLVNLGFTMPIKLYWIKKIAIKFHIIKIRWGTMFCSGRFFRRKFMIFLFWYVNSIVHLNSYFSMQAAQGATLFCEMFYGDPKLSV